MNIIYLWRDARDHNMISIGIKTKSAGYMSWTSVFIDGIEELFGRRVYDILHSRDFGNQVLPLRLTVETGELE